MKKVERSGLSERHSGSVAALRHDHGGGDDGCPWRRKKAGEGEGKKWMRMPGSGGEWRQC